MGVKLKHVYFLTAILLSLQSSLTAAEQNPNLSELLFTSPEQNNVQQSNTNKQSAATHNPLKFDFFLNKSKQEIISSYENLINDNSTYLLYKEANIPVYEYKEKSVNNQISFLILTFNMEIEFDTSRSNLPQPTAVYIIQDNLCIGYILIDTMEVFKPNNFPLYQAIKSSPKQNKPLKNKLTIPSDKQINFYTVQRSDDYIEQYGLMHVDKDSEKLRIESLSNHSIAMLSFYPQHLESAVIEEIVPVLNHNLEKYASWIH